jgi:hypothetical protein
MTESWKASQPAPIKAGEQSQPQGWESGQGTNPKLTSTMATAAPAGEETKAKESSNAGTVNVKETKPIKTVEKGGSESLLVISSLMEGLVFGSLYGWAVLRKEGVKLSPETKRYLGYASVLSPLLLLDSKDCCKIRMFDSDFGILALHVVLSLKSWLERSLESVGPWSLNEKLPTDNLLAIVAFIAHLRCFLHLLVREAKGSLAKKVALIASFTLGMNLTVT